MSSRFRSLSQVVQGIQLAQQHLSTQINRIIDPLGLNMSQLTVLGLLSNQPNRCQTISLIVKATGMNQPAVTKIVSCLINRGWVSKEADPLDARKRSLKITAAGLGVVIKAYGKLTPAIDTAFASINDEQAFQLQVLLKQLNNG